MSVADIILAKTPLPTHLSSAEIRTQWAAKLRQQALFSAKMANESYLKTIQSLLVKLINREIDPSAFRIAARDKLAQIGYLPDTNGPIPMHDLTNHASSARLNLIIKVNRGKAASMAQIARHEDPVLQHAYPAWLLKPIGGYRKTHRTDWAQRWQAAGDSVAWQGAVRSTMAALKGSPIWQALGDGAGGYRDALGDAFPPFAFNTSYYWEPLPAAKWRELAGEVQP